MADEKEKLPEKEHPALSRIALGVYAAQTASRESYECKRARRKEKTGMILYYDKTDASPRVIPAGVGEMFGYRLAEYACVRVPRVTLTTDPPEDFTQHHVKKVVGGWMLPERVPASIPVYYLSDLVSTSAISDQPEHAFRSMFKGLFDKRCPLGREAYADFPTEPPQAALEAARWDSDERLRHYAYRALLGCTYPHSSNVLVDTDGRLFLIDHEKICASAEGDDLALVMRGIADSPAAIDVCRRVAEGITQETIERALEGIPDVFWRSESRRKSSLRNEKRYARYDNPRDAAGYFIERLNRWYELFSERRLANAS